MEPTNVRESFLFDNKVMGKMSPSQCFPWYSAKKPGEAHERHEKKKLILNRHSLFEYYRLTGFLFNSCEKSERLRERQRKNCINIHFTLADSHVPSFYTFEWLILWRIIYLYLSKIE